MIILILVVVLWIAVLVPTALSKVNERRGAGSIGRFHQRLNLLERTGPKIVEPAYRLTGTGVAMTSSSRVVVATPPPPVRPSLVLMPSSDDVDLPAPEGHIDTPAPLAPVEDVIVQLRSLPVDPEEADFEADSVVDYEASGDGFDDEVEFAEAPGTPPLNRSDRRELAALEQHRLARRRRRDTFGALCALTALTGVLGLAHPLRGAWIASGLFLGLLVAFVGLAAYGQRIEAERRHLAKLQLEKPHELVQEPESTVKYLSTEELAQYHGTLASYHESEDSRLAAQG